MTDSRVYEALYSCPVCGATVGESSVQRHQAWHRTIGQELRDAAASGAIEGVPLNEWPGLDDEDEPTSIEPVLAPGR